MTPVAIGGIDKQGVAVGGVQVKQSLDAANSIVNKGVYNATLLETVDPDLAVANILTGKTIFGKNGTVVSGTLAEDVEGEAKDARTTDTEGTYFLLSTNTGGDSETTLATVTLAFNATSLAFAAGVCHGRTNRNVDCYIRLYMDGVQMQQEVCSADTFHSYTYVLHDFKAISGNKICKLVFFNDNISPTNFDNVTYGNGNECPNGIAVGSVKLV